MAQYKTGTVTVTNGSTAVTGVGTAWLANASVGDLLWVGNGLPLGVVAAVTADGALTLETPWAGETLTSVAYALVRDFEAKTGAPLLAQGDIGTADVFNRAVASLATGMQLKTLDAISPLDYGAVSDGATDSAAALAAALTAAAGGTLVLRGRYACSTTLTVPANTAVVGDGEIVFTNAGCLMLSAGAVVDGLTISGSTATATFDAPNAAICPIGNGTTIRNVTIDAPTDCGIYVKGVDHTTVDSFRILNAGGSAIWGYNTSNLDVRNGYILSPAGGGGGLMGGCTNSRWSNIYVTGSPPVEWQQIGLNFGGYGGGGDHLGLEGSFQVPQKPEGVLF